MIDHAADLAAVFYGPEFAHHFTRQRPGVDDVTLVAIFGLEDVEALEGRATVAKRLVRFIAGQDVRADDLLIAQEDIEPGLPAGSRFKLLEHPRRVVDGREVEALLSSVPA